MTKPVLIGLTGSIGMGKSTTSTFFADEGIPVWDADAAVHRLYAKGGKAVEPLGELIPDAIKDGSVDRQVLKDEIARDSTFLPKIEMIVHPLVAADRQAFIEETQADIIVLDIPLLFENQTEDMMDYVIVVSAPEEVQRERVLARPGMTEVQLETILSRQMPDAKKRARADYVIETISMEAARKSVQTILAEIREKLIHA